MKSSTTQLKTKKTALKVHGKISASFLSASILIACFLTDQLLPNSNLSIPLALSALASGIFTWWSIPKLKALKIKQLIREEGPKEHLQKAGTPTMGGLIIIPLGVMIGSLFNIQKGNTEQLLAVSLLTFTYMLIGVLDDWQSLKSKKNKGLTPNKKLLLQAIGAMPFLIWAGLQGWIDTSISLPLGNSIQAEGLIWPIALFVFLAESNSTNLNDGLDGMASGCGALVATGLAIQLMLRGNQEDAALAGFCIAMAGTWLGFLSQNKNPAKIFMGDAGSLAIGGCLSAVALLSNNLWGLFIMGGVFVAESISVIIQVWIFKITKKIYGKGLRVLKMSPLHHHFELTGMNEARIVTNFWLVTSGLVLLGLLIPTTF